MMKQLKVAKYLFISIIIFTYINCSPWIENEDVEVSIDTSIFLRNGDSIGYPHIVVTDTILNNLGIRFVGSYSENPLDEEGFSMSLNFESEDINWMKYSLFVDGDQEGYIYEFVEGTSFLKIDNLDVDNKIVNVKWGGTFIRTSTLGWELDFPHRVDVVGIYHGNF